MSLLDGIPPYLFTRTQHRAGTPLNDTAINRDLIKPINELQRGVEQLSNRAGPSAGVFFADDYPSLQAAVTACGNTNGGTVQCSGKSYDSVTLNNTAPIWIRGTGKFTTTIWGSGSVSPIAITGSTGIVKVTDLTVASSGATGGAGIYTTGSGTPGTIVQDVLCIHTYYGLYINSTGAGLTADHVSVIESVSDGVYVDGGFEGFDLQTNFVGGDAVHVVNGGVRLINNDHYKPHGAGVRCQTKSGGSIFATYLDEVTVEQNFIGPGFSFDSNSGAGGATCFDVYLRGCRAQQMQGFGFELAGVNEVHLSDCMAWLCGQGGFSYGTSGSVNTTRCTQTGGRAQGNTGDGILLWPSCSDISFSGVQSYSNSGHGIATTGAGDYLIAYGCNFRGNGTSSISNGASGANNNINAANNIT